MILRLVRVFQRTLVLQTSFSSEPAFTRTPIYKVLIANQNYDHRRSLFNFERKRAKLSINSAKKDKTNNNEFDSEEYIVPYCVENEKTVNTAILVEILRERFRLSAAEVRQILSDENVSRVQQNRSILLLTLDSLSFEGIDRQSIVENPWLLTLEKSKLDEKLVLIKSMAIQDINHFVPFLRLSVSRIRKLVSFLNNESSVIPFKNRVYYISERLKVSPSIVTKYMPKRLFILEMPFEMLEKNLNNMISYNVSAIDVLKDLWAFRYTPKSVQLRLERAKIARKNKLMPWMVRCPETILQRSLKLTQDELAVLNGKNSAAEYIAERLGFNLSETKAIMDKHPQVYRVRVTKVKEVLDYLIDEAGFSRHEVAQVPRVLCHSLKTTKDRFKELQSMHCRPSSLVILCRSKREYDKFKEAWQMRLQTSEMSKISAK